MPTDDLVRYINEKATVVGDWFAMSAALRDRERATGDIQAGWMMTAFDYVLAWRGRDRQSAAFGEQWSGGGQTYPIPLGEVPDEVIDLWRNVFERAEHPVVLARLGHLLFERDGGPIGRAAAAAYLELGTGTWDRIERATCLDWAADLARRVGARDTVDAVVVALIDLATASLAADVAEPGVSLYAVSVVLELDPAQADTAGLLETARRVYGGDAWLTADVIRLQERLVKGDPVRLAELHRAEVEAHLAHADRADGLVRMVALQEAGTKASRFGLTDLRDGAVAAMQAMSPDELGLKTFSTTVEVPTADVEAAINAYVDADTLVGALARLVAGPPPSGPVDANRGLADRSAEANPLTSLIPSTRLGRDGLPQMHATNDTERADERLARVEMNRLAITGPIEAEALSRILAKFGPSEDDLVGVLGMGVAPDATKGVARALLRYERGDYEGAAFTAAPRIEAFLRAHLLTAGVPIFRLQRGPTRGQYQQLGSLLSTIKDRLDPSWHRFLWTFLVSAWGANYRNELLHGFIGDVDPIHAALVLIAAMHVAVMPGSQHRAPDGPP